MPGASKRAKPKMILAEQNDRDNEGCVAMEVLIAEIDDKGQCGCTLSTFKFEKKIIQIKTLAFQKRAR